MKIAIVTETFHPDINGVVTRLTFAIRWLSRQGHQILVIAPDQGIAEYEGAEVRGVPSFSFFLYKGLKLALPGPSVGKVLRQFAPDVVHVVNPAVLGASGIWYGQRWPLIASYHTNVPQYADFYKFPWLKPALWSYLRLLHNRADLNLCTSQAIAQELTAHGFKNVQLWKRGVDLERFGPHQKNRAMRERLTGGQPDKPLLLYVGRLAAEKGIERIRDILRADDDIRLAIVGDGPHRKSLASYYAGTSTVFTGFLQGDELAQAYASSDLFVFPSTTETLGLVLLEAMASGLPVVAAASGPSREQIEHGSTGFLFEPYDSDGLVNTVLSVMRNRSLLERFSRQARQYSISYGWDEPSRQLLDFYRSVVGIPSRPAGTVSKEEI